MVKGEESNQTKLQEYLELTDLYWCVNGFKRNKIDFKVDKYFNENKNEIYRDLDKLSPQERKNKLHEILYQKSNSLRHMKKKGIDYEKEYYERTVDTKEYENNQNEVRKKDFFVTAAGIFTIGIDSTDFIVKILAMTSVTLTLILKKLVDIYDDTEIDDVIKKQEDFNFLEEKIQEADIEINDLHQVKNENDFNQYFENVSEEEIKEDMQNIDIDEATSKELDEEQK